MERSASLDLYKVLLSTFVVGIHTNLFFDVSERLTFYLNEGLFRVAVPTFILITGYYFTTVDTKEKLYKWCVRISILFIFWTLVYFPFWNREPKLLIKLLVVSNGYVHLWYLLHMLLAGIILFFLRKKIWYKPIPIALVLFFIGCVIQYSVVYTHNETINKFFKFTLYAFRNFAFFCLPFLIIGTYIKDKCLQSNPILLILGIILFLTEISLNFLFSQNFSNAHFDLYFSLILITPALFLTIKEVLINSVNGKTIALVANSVYFTHFFILKLISHFGVESSILKWSVVILLSLVISFPIIFINNRLKYKIL